jgi:hypothetical protein
LKFSNRVIFTDLERKAVWEKIGDKKTIAINIVFKVILSFSKTQKTPNKNLCKVVENEDQS